MKRKQLGGVDLDRVHVGYLTAQTRVWNLLADPPAVRTVVTKQNGLRAVVSVVSVQSPLEELGLAV